MIFAESERLILRRPRADDLEPMLIGWTDPEMSRWTPDRPDPRGFLTQLIADMQVKRPGETEPGGPWYQYVVERRSDGAVIGDLGAGFETPGPHQVEIGYRILPPFQRSGFAREAVAALIDHLIERHRVHRFVGIVAAPHETSKRVLRSLGFRHEGHFRESFWCGGQWVDDDVFALLASEWQARSPTPAGALSAGTLDR
jgi:RimJ/RimL family protein N-acetyltransferase